MGESGMTYTPEQMAEACEAGANYFTGPMSQWLRAAAATLRAVQAQAWDELMRFHGPDAGKNIAMRIDHD